MEKKITDDTTKFLKSKFKQYYSNLTNLELPLKLNQREWGFIQFDSNFKIKMKRHIYFENELSCSKYIINTAPAHIYYSVAYYEKPFLNEMNDKIWKGADLIFDLDCDHIFNSQCEYSKMLLNIKNETLKLILFLKEDFGFKDDQLEIVFSGDRGYHIHVYDSKIKDINNSCRREIVDYITGKGIELKYYIHKFYENDKNKSKEKYKFEKINSGWGKRFTNYFTDILKKEFLKDEKEVFKELRNLKIITSHNIKKILNLNLTNKFYDAITMNGQLDFPIKNFESIVEYVMLKNNEQMINSIGCNIDEPVTCDIKRLIRFPGSLHGNTGLKVMKIPIDNFEFFNPLNDAIVFNSNLVKVNIIKPFHFEIANEEYTVEEKTKYLPEYAAIYLMCKGIANYGCKRN